MPPISEWFSSTIVQFRANSRGDVALPSVDHITFASYDADCHIKYGH